MRWLCVSCERRVRRFRGPVTGQTQVRGAPWVRERRTSRVASGAAAGTRPGPTTRVIPPDREPRRAQAAVRRPAVVAARGDRRRPGLGDPRRPRRRGPGERGRRPRRAVRTRPGMGPDGPAWPPARSAMAPARRRPVALARRPADWPERRGRVSASGTRTGRTTRPRRRRPLGEARPVRLSRPAALSSEPSPDGRCPTASDGFPGDRGNRRPRNPLGPLHPRRGEWRRCAYPLPSRPAGLGPS